MSIPYTSEDTKTMEPWERPDGSVRASLSMIRATVEAKERAEVERDELRTRVGELLKYIDTLEKRLDNE